MNESSARTDTVRISTWQALEKLTDARVLSAQGEDVSEEIDEAHSILSRVLREAPDGIPLDGQTPPADYGQAVLSAVRQVAGPTANELRTLLDDISPRVRDVHEKLLSINSGIPRRVVTIRLGFLLWLWLIVATAVWLIEPWRIRDWISGQSPVTMAPVRFYKHESP